VEGVWRVLNRVPRADAGWDGGNPNPASSSAPYRLFNIGNQRAVSLLQFIELIEKKLGRKAEKVLLPLQPGDVVSTCADISDLRRYAGYEPATDIETGVARFCDWFTGYYGK
jgi:UDP-glucuronate 4-epimerase